MTSVPTSIWLALKSRIDTLNLSSPAWPTWPVAWQGGDYEPKSGKPYIAIGRATGIPIRRVINANVQDRSGYLIVTAVMPIGQQTVVYEDVAARIADHFQGCIVHSGITLTLMSSSGGVTQVQDGYRDGGWWRVPVSIPWRTWR